MTYGTVNVDSVVNSDGVTSGGLYGFKNRIINGAMVIDQRNAGASITPTSASEYTLDRWLIRQSSYNYLTVRQNLNSITPPSGFTNYLGVSVNSAFSVGADDFFDIRQTIEGYNVADFDWGGTSPKPITISFWVQSSLTGTFGGAVFNTAGVRSYPFTYTISAANTWEYKTVAIPADTTAIGNTTNGAGLRVCFGLGVGSTYSDTAGTWVSANKVSATGAVSVVGTSGATFYITGVQLEKGSTATSFDYRPYGTELALCQRYYTFFLGSGSYERAGFGLANSTTSAPIGFSQPVAMRTGPTIAYSGSISLYNGSSFAAVTSFTVDYSGIIYSTVVANVASGLTSGAAYQLLSANNTTARVTLSAEI